MPLPFGCPVMSVGSTVGATVVLVLRDVGSDVVALVVCADVLVGRVDVDSVVDPLDEV